MHRAAFSIGVGQLNTPREKLEIEDERDQKKEVAKDRDTDRGQMHGL
jgi:hypothetical protein